MDVLVALIVIIVFFLACVGLYLLYMGFIFHCFKTKLMNEFGRHGIPFDEANSLYTANANQIHGLRNDNCTPEKIVNLIINSASLQNAPAIKVASVITAKEFPLVKELFDSIESGSPRLTGYGVYVMSKAIEEANLDNASKHLHDIATISYRYLSGQYDENYIDKLINGNYEFQILVNHLCNIILQELNRDDFSQYKVKISEQLERDL